MSQVQIRFIIALVKTMLLALCLMLLPRPATGGGDVRTSDIAGTDDGDSPRIETPVRRLDGRTLSPEFIAATIERLRHHGNVTGLAVTIANRNEIVYRRAFGWADADSGHPLDENTLMYAASITKAMFAYLVMQLVDDGLLDLDRPIAAYLPKPLPEYEKYADLAGDERWRAITPRMLLSHTSGLPNWRWFDFDAETIAFDADGKLRLRVDPGTRYGYSGEGINLLQFVLETGLDLDIGQLMRERVFDPLDMPRTDSVWHASFAANLANGHDEAGAGLGHKQRLATRAAGSVDSDLVGISRFLRGVLRQTGLSHAGFAEMFKPQVRIRSRYQFPVGDGVHHDTPTDRDDPIELSYGLGWGLFDTPHGRAFFKEGHDDGWENYMVAFPEAGIGIAILTNSSNGESIFKALLAELIGDVWTPWQWNNYVPYDADATMGQ